jgi:hypothetical protein
MTGASAQTARIDCKIRSIVRIPHFNRTKHMTSTWTIPRSILRPLALALALPTLSLAQGPYSPAAGQPGSDAISDQDPRFTEWASGFLNYVKGSPINNAFTDPTQTLGPAKGTTTGVTELGDGGQITLTFANPILASASGPDFVVFGNSFDGHYLKLAYVEVSQDDVNWFRMPNDSLTAGPVGTFGDNMDPTNINGLAGKYVVGFGVPFSLRDVGLATASYVRLVDIIGNGSDLDSAGRPIFDPTPNSDGFNASGVGVISMVPEPASIGLLVLGGVFITLRWQRRHGAAKNAKV